MPFTAAHPALVLPFLRLRYFSATGLIAGSMVPDFESFFVLSVQDFGSHTLPGVLYFNLPVAVLLAFVFHRVVKTNLISNLPPFLQRRLKILFDFDFVRYVKRHWGIFLVSVLLGALSHLFWDSFTHSAGYFAQRFYHFYHGTYIRFQGVNYPLFYALQHISTAVGLFTGMLYVLLLAPQPGRLVRPRVLYWLLFMLIAGTTVGIRFMVYRSDYNLGNLVVSAIGGSIVGLVVNGFINFNNHGQTITMGAGRQTGG